MYSKPTDYSPGVDFNTPALKKYRSLRFLKDHLARWGVAAGGLSVILAILLIFFYLLYEVAPLFKSAEIEEVTRYNTPAGAPLYLAMEEQAEIALRAYADGSLLFNSTTSGARIDQLYLPVPSEATVLSVVQDSTGSSLMAAGLSNGQIILFKQDYKISWPNDQRVITPSVSFPYGTKPLPLFSSGNAIQQLSISDSEEQLLITASTEDQIKMTAFTKEEDFLTETITLKQQDIDLPLLNSHISKLLISPDQQWLYVASGRSQLELVNLSNIDATHLHSTVNLTDDNTQITDLQFLLGGVSLLAGDSSGSINQWFLVRDNGTQHLELIRSFQLGNQPVERIIPEHRRKGFMAVDTSGAIGLFYTTAHRTLLKQPLPISDIRQIAIAPRGNYLMVDGSDGVSFQKVENEHPEISWSALWNKIWYESYDKPEYIWQSSAANNDFEAKLSLTPLAFGTLKAAFYAMLLAAPLAICGAIYTAYFMAPVMRRKVKPVIELMEALPTVILGFLAGLWLAPLVESNLVGIFALMIFVPVGILSFALFWDSLPSRIRHTIPEGWQAALLIPVVLLSGWLAMAMNGHLEQWLFNGDMRVWLTTELGIPFDQRNALVVGLAMGFAVIPTIFSIAEDAIFSVPKHLSYGSLALGATPWQTLTRVVLLTASPGIFSALMIGMGRAVGETMIVLMATGNTPIMDANIFEGMRTLAANIAVEMPESEVGSSHYRVLFLAALVLFMFTFIVNTAAEIVRHRLRKKYSSL
ncbi:phosphate ABC transporter permease [Endozoicomonas sp. (ex Bugula neritina AB1)]|nr:phosphate ABC transporter permease [Endozoicomonas sp. (ex Bugula neritina AB1)]